MVICCINGGVAWDALRAVFYLALNSHPWVLGTRRGLPLSLRRHLVKRDSRDKKRSSTHLSSLSHLLPAMAMGTRGSCRLPRLLPLVALAFVSRICSRSRITSSNDSRLSIANTRTKISPADEEIPFS